MFFAKHILQSASKSTSFRRSIGIRADPQLLTKRQKFSERSWNIFKKVYKIGVSTTLSIFVVKSIYNAEKLTLALEVKKYYVVPWSVENTFKNIIYSVAFPIFWPIAIYSHKNSEICETIFGNIKINHIETYFIPFSDRNIKFLCDLDERYKHNLAKNKEYYDDILTVLTTSKVNVNKKIYTASNVDEKLDILYEQMNSEEAEKIFNEGQKIKTYLEAVGILVVTECAF